MTIELKQPAQQGFRIASGDVFYRITTDEAFVVSHVGEPDAYRIIYFKDGSGAEYSYPKLRRLIEALGYQRYAIEKLVLKPAQ